MMKEAPVLQISLDHSNLDAALAAAQIAVDAGIDWLEAGTPLIMHEGVRAVKALRERFPNVPLVADIKGMDGGGGEAAMMARAGANYVVVMSVAAPATVAAAVRSGKEHGIKVMADIMAAPDRPAYARRMEELGVDIVVDHIGYDERTANPSLNIWSDLDAILKAVTIPVQAVGGLSLEDLERLPAAGVRHMVVGGPIVGYRPGDEATLGEKLSEVVQRVKKQG